MKFDSDDLKKLHENKPATYVRSVVYAALTYIVYAILLFAMNLALAAIYEGQPLVIYGLEVATAIFFLAFCGILTLLFGRLEKKLNYYRG